MRRYLERRPQASVGRLKAALPIRWRRRFRLRTCLASLPVLRRLVDVPRRFIYPFPFSFALQGEQGVCQRFVALRLPAEFAVAVPPLGVERTLFHRALDGE